MTPNNISRATKGLSAKGWLTIHYLDGRKSREIANYELSLAGSNTGTKGVQGPAGASKRQTTPTPLGTAVEALCAGEDRAAFDAFEADSNDLTVEELEALLEKGLLG